MKTVFTFLVIGIFLAPAFTQETEAPVNSEFLKWQQEVLGGKSNTGDIPFYVEPNFNGLSQNKGVKSFSAVYDLRNEGFVTTPKDQGSCGVCWTFTALGSVESFMLKNGLGTHDFSEQNMRTCHGFETGTELACTGGSTKKAGAYLTRIDGPVLDAQDLYDADLNASCVSGLQVPYRVEQFKVLPNDTAIVKQSILDYGALYVNMMYDGAYYNSSNYTYYYGGTASTDHAVLLCGWDDTKVTAGGTGAWIIKNSWGDTWGENGYFYISYNDTKALSTVGVYPGVSQIETNDKLYMIDDLGWIGNVGYGSETANGLIKYVAAGNEQINAVGTYVNSEAATVSVEIYNTKSGNTLSGLLASTGTMSCDYPGYYKIDLASPVSLTAGQDFYIKVEYHTPGYNFPIPYEKYSAGYADPVIESDICWISSTGSSWTAVGNNVAGKERDLCIRAYTGGITSSSKELTLSNLEMSVYPQPAKDELFIEFNADVENFTLNIVSVDGKTVMKSQEVSKNKNVVFVHELSSGIYLIQVLDKNNNLIISEKFIKD